MIQSIKPILNYVYGQEIKADSGVVSHISTSDTKQKYKVLSVGPGSYEFGVFIEPTIKKGDIVIIQKHASEGDSPQDMLNDGYALFQANRIMAVEDKNT